jgi:glycosyltransferase involved in cell wall biosynthesis
MSVAMCTYNGAGVLPAQLASIRAQTRLPDQVVICDDGSTDATRSTLEAFAAQSPAPVSIHVNEKNLGAIRNFEQAIGLCEGDVIVLSDQDDVWREDRLEVIERSFLDMPSAGLVFSDADIVDQDLNPVGRRMWHEVGFDNRQRRLVAEGRAIEVLLPGWTATGATMAFRSEYRRLILPIPPEIPMIHDGWIALAIGATGTVIPLDTPLIKYRQHSGQLIGPPRPRARPLAERVRATLRRNHGEDLRRVLGALDARLSAQSGSFDCERAIAYVRDYTRHLDARAGLPRRRLRRVPPILRELSSGGYHRYASGLKSALKDFVV